MNAKEILSGLAWPLVAAQMSLIASIVSAGDLPGRLFPPGLHFLAMLLIVAAVFLGLWAIVAMRLSNFSVLPIPVSSGILCQRGPYSKIRHPMYTAVILGCCGFCLVATTWHSWLTLAALIAVLIAKLHLEEVLLTQRYPAYTQYIQNTHRLVPALY